MEVFLANDPERLEEIRNQLKKLVPLTDAGQLNTVMPSVLKMLKATGLPVTTTDGVTTSYSRDQLGIEKSHVNDAACLDLPQHVSNLVAKTTILKRQGRHKRQSINCNKFGTPDSDKFPDYSRLPRSKPGIHHPARSRQRTKTTVRHPHRRHRPHQKQERQTGNRTRNPTPQGQKGRGQRQALSINQNPTSNPLRLPPEVAHLPKQRDSQALEGKYA